MALSNDDGGSSWAILWTIQILLWLVAIVAYFVHHACDYGAC